MEARKEGDRERERAWRGDMMEGDSWRDCESIDLVQYMHQYGYCTQLLLYIYICVIMYVGNSMTSRSDISLNN